MGASSAKPRARKGASAAATAAAADVRLTGRIGMPVRLTVGHRERFLDAARGLVARDGYADVSCQSVCDAAGMPNNVFYELFAGKEDCVLALLERELSVLEGVARPAFEKEREWSDRVRAGLAAVLGYLDRSPDVAGVVFVASLAGGPRVLGWRGDVLGRLSGVVDGGRLDGRGRERAKQPPAVTARALVGGVCGVISSRVVERGREGSLSDLLGELMASIVLPYRGRAAAKREIASQTSAGRVGRGRRERGVLRTRVTEDEEIRRAADV